MSPIRRRENGRDSGFTLIELLVTIVLMSLVTTAVAAVTITIMRNEQPTMERISESKDISFLQAAIPADLGSAESRDTTPTLQPSSSNPLPGTNVLTITRTANGVSTTVSYRYVQVGKRWQLARYEISGLGTASEAVVFTGAAYELKKPPSGWTPDTAPTHAVIVNDRTPTGTTGAGQDLTLIFSSGKRFTTGGATLASTGTLPSD